MRTARHARSPRSGSPPNAIAAAAGSWCRTVSRRSGVHRTLWQLQNAHALRRRVIAGLVLGSFAGVYLLGDAAPGVYVVPIVLAAIEFGVAGGLAAGLLSLALVFGWDLSTEDANLDVVEYLSRAFAYLLLGGLLGHFVTQRRSLEAKVTRSEQLSRDLMATADFDGYFTRVNDSWQRTLGWSRDELCSRPLIDFVHPDDRERTLAELACLAEGRDAIAFRNRYRGRDGSYHWLEWNACSDLNARIIHANARDITLLHQAEEAIRDHGEELECTVRVRTGELEQSRRETLQRLALAAEYRDDDTHNHTERVGRTSMLIARALGLSDATVRTICEAVPLHDVGKLGISDTILLKAGPLTAAEYSAMQHHTLIGAAILVDSGSSVLQMAAQVALNHHERWNGSGYPNGVAGEDIPLVARIAAIADTFDAITHARPYKDAQTIEHALAEIRSASGTQFDPCVVTAFLELDHAGLVHGAPAHV